MRYFLFLTVLFLALPVSAQAPEGMYMCGKTSDCIVVEDFCKNNWRAINAMQTETFKEWTREVKPFVECNPLKPSVKPQPECDGNRCIVHSPVPGKQ